MKIESQDAQKAPYRVTLPRRLFEEIRGTGEAIEISTEISLVLRQSLEKAEGRPLQIVPGDWDEGEMKAAVQAFMGDRPSRKGTVNIEPEEFKLSPEIFKHVVPDE